MTVRTDEVRSHANLIWSIAELLRGDYKRSEYGRVVLPLVVARRLDQVLLPTKAAVLARASELEARGIQNIEPALIRTAGQPFFNRSSLIFSAVDEGVAGVQPITADPANVGQNLRSYVDRFSSIAKQVFDHFDFERQTERLDAANLAYQVVSRVCEVDLHPDRVSNLEMGYLFEELIRRFAEQSNETAGEHFTPREVVRLMVNLLLDGDQELLRDPGIIRTVFDCACGTGGMLSEAEEQIHRLNPDAVVHLYGQELNGESYAICLADMLVKGHDARIKLGNSLSDDQHRHERQGFHYGIANPPFGVDWSKVEAEVREEHKTLGDQGRFGPGLPRKSDGQLLFLMHLMSKMRAVEPDGSGGGRVAIVLNGSPLFTGAAGSGESEIRRHIIENDLLEAIVALPEQLFYNTGIATYVWLVTNRKSPEREGKVQIIDARESWTKMRKSLGEKRREVAAEQIAEITRLHGSFEEGKRLKIVPNASLGYRTIMVEQPLRARWEVRPEAWEGVEDASPVAKLDHEQRRGLLAALRAMSATTYDTEDETRKALRTAIGDAVAKPSASLLGALLDQVIVRDRSLLEQRDKNGDVIADKTLRDTENIPLDEDVEAYLDREVRPHVPGAWCPDPEGRVGYEIPFTRLFYTYTPPRPSEEIKAELRELEGEIRRLLEEVLV